MAETEIKKINGRTIADTTARAQIEELKKSGGISGGTNATTGGTVVHLQADAATKITVEGQAEGIVRLVHHGRNFLPPCSGEAFTRNGLSFTPNPDGTVRITGTATANTWLTVGSAQAPALYLPAGQYVLTMRATYSGAELALHSVDNSVVKAVGFNYNRMSIQVDLSEGMYFHYMYAIRSGTQVDEDVCAQIDAGYGAEAITEYEPYRGEVLEHLLPIEVDAYDGENILYTESGDLLTVTARKSLESMIREAVSVDYDAFGLPVLALQGSVSAMSKDNAVDLYYTFDQFGLSGILSCKWQGSSSLRYPEKNYTLTFDQAFEAAEGWGAQTKYCVKADWIDFSHLRNRVNAQLWGRICADRGGDPLAGCPNYGAIDGFPIILMLNDEFMGVYNFNIPKDGWMAGMGSGTREFILCADAPTSDACGFKAAATLDTDFSVEYITDPDDTAWAQTALNDLISACVSSDGSDLDTTIGNMLDWDRAIDYYIFTALIRGDDMVLKNYLLLKKDDTTILFGYYDGDCTYGLYWDGSKWLDSTGGMTFTAMASRHRLFELIRTHKTAELKARYASLRATVLSEDNILTLFTNAWGRIPQALYVEDNKRWPGKPNTAANTVHQIIDWYRLRCVRCDAEIEAM